MNALQWIIKEAKSLKRKFPKRYSTWKEYVAQASAIYASKHKGKSPVGKKRKVSGVKKHTDTKSHNVNIKIGSVKKIKFSKSNLDKIQQNYKYKGVLYEIHQDQDGKPYIRVNGKVIYFTGVPRIAGWTKGSTHFREKGEKLVRGRNYRVYRQGGKWTGFSQVSGNTPSKFIKMSGFTGEYPVQREIVVGKLGKIGVIKTIENLIPNVKVRVTRGKKFYTEPVIDSIQKAAEVLKKYITQTKLGTQEHAAVMYMDRSNRVIGVYLHTTGGITSTIIDIRLILAAALKLGAVGLILSHNHPSGNLRASEADIRMTKELIKACSYHSIDVVDHIILTPNSYTSMKQDGLM